MKIKKIYKLRKNRIQSRLEDFETYYNKPVSWFYDEDMELKKVDREDNKRLFEELTFCLLTANTSAEMGLKGVDALRDIMFTGSLEDLQSRLKQAGYRYPNKRAEYIVEAREKFSNNLKEIIESTDDPKEMRKFFAENVKGLGYKESSHFLRNVGVFGLAILDKHILRTMEELDVIDEVPKYMNKKRYLEIEEKLIDYSNEIGINIDELDLLLWSMKSGRILK